MAGPSAPSSPPAKSPSPAKSPAQSPASPAAAPTPAPVDTGAIVADENPEDDRYDLGIDLGAESDTASLRSSILKYREENGRTYHAYKDGAYFMPNDDDENERLDLQHTILLLTFDSKLHVAPLDPDTPPRRVLDAGCGTGVWGIEFADEYPESQVTGIDLSPIQPPFVPPNVSFFIDDLEDDWNFSTPFDYVFSRMMTGSLADWPRFFKQSYENLTPGGFIEMQDVLYPVLSDDGTLEGTSFDRWSKLMTQAAAGAGRPLDSGIRYEQQMIEAGFVDVTVVKRKWPVNRWPKEKKYKQLGIWNLENFLAGLAGGSYALFTRPKSENGLGWSKEEVEVLLAGVRRDIRDTSIHAYMPMYAVYGRKPLTA